RLRNALEEGSEMPTGQKLGGGIGLKATMRAVQPHYVQARASLDEARRGQSGEVRRGVGVASGWKGIGRLGGSNLSQALVELGQDGRVRLFTGACDIGQGSSTTLAQIAAFELKLPLESIEVISADTDLTPDCGLTSASRQTYMSGNAVMVASRSLRQALLTTASRALERKIEDLELRDGALTSISDPTVKLSLREVAALCIEAGTPLRHKGSFDTPSPKLDPETGQGIISNPNVYATQMAEVEVNTRTGEVKVLRVVAAQDVGRAVNMNGVEGQVEGGAIMGLGFALMEEFVHGKTFGFNQYRIPTTKHMPELVSIIVEEPDPKGPYGAKGAGENSSLAAAPAIINAIHDACGARVFNLPATPKRVL
ncbi:MAG: molybdopterin-dependent oxidoreductase, partial [Dehalococcoidia bacterium]|nr:molybdopterin-dependent oxidoreductase [Dehalococcoidia bacterium]